jgi:hypothetical protein
MSEQNTQASEAMIPKSRLDQVLEQKRQLQTQLEGLTSRMGELESTLQAAQALTSRVQELEASLETTRAQATTERTLFQSGLRDEEGLKVAQMLYNAQPEEGRPSLAEWMENPPRAVQLLRSPLLNRRLTGEPFPSRPAPPPSALRISTG